MSLYLAMSTAQSPYAPPWRPHGGILMERAPAGLPVAEQRVLFGGRQLSGGASLAAAGVADADTLHILARLLGGGKKRKKKTYTKPKKQKHKHKKIKMRVLKFFKARRPPRAAGPARVSPLLSGCSGVQVLKVGRPCARYRPCTLFFAFGGCGGAQGPPARASGAKLRC